MDALVSWRPIFLARSSLIIFLRGTTKWLERRPVPSSMFPNSLRPTTSVHPSSLPNARFSIIRQDTQAIASPTSPASYVKSRLNHFSCRFRMVATFPLSGSVKSPTKAIPFAQNCRANELVNLVCTQVIYLSLTTLAQRIADF